MIVQEESDDCPRFFGKPYHSLLLNIYRTDDGEKLGAQVMTMEREGWCSKLFLGCFACGPGCQDGMVLHAGTVRGKPGKIPTSQAIAHSRVPKWGGGLHPTLQVMDRGVSAVEEPYAVVRGPTCFGGCTELCCKKDFGVSKVPQGWKPGSYKDLHPGDAATITKKKPQSFKGVMKQLFTDADTYLVEFKDPSMTPQQKAAMLGSMLLLDYMFFDRDLGDRCSFDARGNVSINISNCYMYGCVCPCTVWIPLGDLLSSSSSSSS